MKKKYKSLIMACVTAMLCSTVGAQKTFRFDFVEGQSYEDNTNAG